jgi:hypothetical protein
MKDGAVTAVARTVLENEPCCVPAEAKARQGPLFDSALAVREQECREDVDEERNVLHGTHYEKEIRVSCARAICARLFTHVSYRTCQHCAVRERNTKSANHQELIREVE